MSCGSTPTGAARSTTPAGAATRPDPGSRPAERLSDRTHEFEKAFAEASEIISSAQGYLSHELQRCVERPGRYVLLVRWETLEDHTEGFRGSNAYGEWKRLLRHFYDPFPTVEHFEAV